LRAANTSAAITMTATMATTIQTTALLSMAVPFVGKIPRR
jgi:hypothetical protein